MDDPVINRNKKIVGRIVYNKVFTPAECVKILAYAEPSSTEAYIRDGIIDPNIRNTSTRVLNLTAENSWIAERIFNIAAKVNQAYYNFAFTGLAELHILEYEAGSFYKWHIDLSSDPNNCTRKISIIVFLSDPADYEGGSLDWSMNGEPDTLNVTGEQGSMVLFPSFLPHKVSPVSRGVRKVLVAWIHGDTFR